MSYPINEYVGQVSEAQCANVKEEQESPEDMVETIRRLRYDLRKANARAELAEMNLRNIRNAVNGGIR